MQKHIARKFIDSIILIISLKQRLGYILETVKNMNNRNNRRLLNATHLPRTLYTHWFYSFHLFPPKHHKKQNKTKQNYKLYPQKRWRRCNKRWDLKKCCTTLQFDNNGPKPPKHHKKQNKTKQNYKLYPQKRWRRCNKRWDLKKCCTTLQFDNNGLSVTSTYTRTPQRIYMYVSKK